jgi:hypothetical protein
MHPEIRKFWEDAGYKIVKNGNGDYLIMVNRYSVKTIYVQSGELDSYYIHDQNIYTEEEMLRIIRLKSFL